MSATPDAAGGISGPDEVPDVDLGKRIEAMRAFLASRPARPEPGPDPDPPPPSPLATFPDRPIRTQASAHPLPDNWRRRLWIPAATALTVGTALVLIVVGIPPLFRGPATGTLSIDTRPAGLSVVIDGIPKGVTPVQVELTPGDHVTELFAGSEHRRVPVTIRAGSQSSQFFELAAAAPAAGAGSELLVRTEPLEASVLVDGRYVGRSPVSVGDLSPGPHTVTMQRDGATVTEQVLIEAGKTAALFVPLSPKPGATAAGWITVAAPVDVQIFEGGRLLGSSFVERIMLPAGPHELDIISEPLGYQEHRTVRVTAGQVAEVNLKWPRGSLSINAIPWAEAFVDDTSVGETPIGNIQVPIGPHEIILRNPQLGERRASVTVTMRDPAKVGVDLRAK